MKISLASSFCLILACGANAVSQVQYPYIRSAQVAARVWINQSTGMYSYNYTLKNGASSAGSLIGFALDINLSSGAANMDTTALSFESSAVEEDFRITYPTVAGRIVPVGFPSSPSVWVGALSQHGTADFDGDSRMLVAPGQSLQGFMLVSKGLPGIRAFTARPLFDVDSLFGSMDDPNNLLTPIQEDSIRLSTYFSGFVVAPVGPPSRFRPLAFVDTISSFIVSARSLGWIADQTTSNKYTGYFSTARSQLQTANISGALSTLQTVLVSANADSVSLLTPDAWALIWHNTQYLILQLQPSFQTKGGIFNLAGTSTLSVRAKPDSNFTSSDTLISLTATLRWQSRYSSITFGTVSSPTYGFTAYGSVTTQGNYKYQTFKTTTHVPLNWTAGSEYELFTAPVNGSAGVEDFTLTNALSGGQWFVDINYLDKTDSVFYQPVATCTGLTSQNKADTWGATAYNGPRHLAMTSTKLHEVYSSGGAIVYRRKNLTGSWEITLRISPDSAANNNDASITIAHDGSLHVVWQEYLPSTDYALFYTRSTDGGTTWRTARRIPQPADSVHIYFQQQWNIYPVIAELSTSQLVVVCCYINGMEYTRSTDLGQNWSPMQSTGATNHSWYTWYPSLANIVSGNCLILTYDTRYTGVWSQKYDGSSWSSEASVNGGVGSNNDMYSSVAFDWDLGRLYAAWSARPGGINGRYGIIFRPGSFNNTWGSQFVQFPDAGGSGAHDFYPSITGWIHSGSHNIDIVYNNSNNVVKLTQYLEGNGTWQIGRVLSSSGYWPNTTLQEEPGMPDYPIRVWTDQSANPYQVTLQSDGTYNLAKLQPPTGITTDLHRRIVLESQRTGSTIWFDLGPLKVVTTANDTTTIPFKKLSLAKPLVATLTNAWDYLGTDTISLPANARSLVFDIDVASRARQDSLGSVGVNVFTVSSFRIDGMKGSQTIPLLSNQNSVSGRKVIDVTAQVGQAITLRMVGTVPATATEPVTIGVGDVYIDRKP